MWHCPPIVIQSVVCLPQLPTHSQLNTLRKTRLLSLRSWKSVEHIKCITHIRTASAVSPSLSTHNKHPPLSYHLVRNRRWFFGRSCRAHRSQAAASLYSSPPSLHTPTHTVPSGSAFTPSTAHQLFRLLPGHMHARARRPSEFARTVHKHTNTLGERKVLRQRVVPLQREQPSPMVGWEGDIRLGYCRTEPCLLFHPPLIIKITLHRDRYAVQDVQTGQGKGGAKQEVEENHRCTKVYEAHFLCS